MSQEDTALPGFEELVRTAVDRAGSNDFTGARYTAGILLRDYPETFKSIAAAIFRYNLPNRVIRDLYHCNGATVRGVHDMVMGAASTDGRGQFLMGCRAASTKSIVITRLLDAILDKLDDPETVEKMNVAELTDVLTRLSPAERDSKSDSKRTIDVTPVQPAEDYDSIINGLVGEKKRAALGPSDAGDETDASAADEDDSRQRETDNEDGPERSTENGSCVNHSFQMSNIPRKSPINSGRLCNAVSKSSEKPWNSPSGTDSTDATLTGSDESPGRPADGRGERPPVRRAASPHPGGRGDPGASARGGCD